MICVHRSHQSHLRYQHSIQHTYTTSYLALIESICIYLVPFSSYNVLFVVYFNLHLATLVEMIPFEFCQDLYCQKIRVPGLLCVAVCVILSLAVLIQYRRVTDTHTRALCLSLLSLLLYWR